MAKRLVAACSGPIYSLAMSPRRRLAQIGSMTNSVGIGGRCNGDPVWNWLIEQDTNPDLQAVAERFVHSRCEIQARWQYLARVGMEFDASHNRQSLKILRPSNIRLR